MGNKAMIVGINAYPQRPLSGCINDAHAIAARIVEGFGFDRADILMLFDEQATKRAILDGLVWLTDGVIQGDRLYFHFSGHGVQMPTVDDGNEADALDECLCPYDFDWSSGNALYDHELDGLFGGADAVGALSTITIDSCHSGGMLRAIGGGVPRSLPAPTHVARRIAQLKAQAARTRSLFRGDSPVRVLLAACLDHQVAMDALNKNGEPCGVFTHYLLEALSLASTVNEATEVTQRLLRAHRFEQTPVADGSSVGRELPFLWRGLGASTDNQLGFKSV